MRDHLSLLWKSGRERLDYAVNLFLIAACNDDIIYINKYVNGEAIFIIDKSGSINHIFVEARGDYEAAQLMIPYPRGLFKAI